MEHTDQRGERGKTIPEVEDESYRAPRRPALRKPSENRHAPSIANRPALMLPWETTRGSSNMGTNAKFSDASTGKPAHLQKHKSNELLGCPIAAVGGTMPPDTVPPRQRMNRYCMAMAAKRIVTLRRRYEPAAAVVEHGL